MLSLTSTDTGGQVVDFAAVTGANTRSATTPNLMKDSATRIADVLQGVERRHLQCGHDPRSHRQHDDQRHAKRRRQRQHDGHDRRPDNWSQGIQITNDTTGLIEGARHGITVGSATNNVILTVTNNAGGVIKAATSGSRE